MYTPYFQAYILYFQDFILYFQVYIQFFEVHKIILHTCQQWTYIYKCKGSIYLGIHFVSYIWCKHKFIYN